MKYNYTEAILGPNFNNKILDQIKVLISTGSSFNIIGMPFVGISPFFRYIATTDLALMIYIDIHGLVDRTKEDLFMTLYKELGGKQNISLSEAYLACEELLKTILKKNERVLIMLNRFDYLNKEEFSRGIFSNLKSLEDIGKGRIIFAVATHRPVYEIDEDGVSDSNLAFLSKLLYFPPYEGQNLKRLLLVSPVGLKPNVRDLNKALYLSGGHATLLQVLIKTEYLNDPFYDPFIKLHLKLIYETCNTKQRNELYKIAVGKDVHAIDPFLVKIGIVKTFGLHLKLFSPLLKEYLISYVKLRLTKKERLLFNLLKSKLGKIVTKDQLFSAIWENDPDLATDWALNSLIYRLRKNPTVLNKYIIENEKNIGYKMIKNT